MYEMLMKMDDEKSLQVKRFCRAPRVLTIFLSVIDKFINFHHPLASSLKGIRSDEEEKQNEKLIH